MESFKLFYEMAVLAKDLDRLGDAAASSHDIAKYTDKGGRVLYVKYPDLDLYESGHDAPIHTIVEYFAYKIYDVFGIRVPGGVDLVINGDTLGLASGEVKGEHPTFQRLGEHKDFVKGFAVDAFLANWDVAGTSFLAANIIIDEDGNLYRIDPGGSLTFRAQGGRKGEMFKPEVGEVSTLRDPEMSKSADAFNHQQHLIKSSFDNFLTVSWTRFSREMDKFNNEKIVKEIVGKMDDGPVKERILRDWRSEYELIMKRLQHRYDSIKRYAEKF